MILRKPYAFLIKHFKIIHLILAFLIYYSIYRTKVLLDFFNEYVANPVNIAGQNLSSTLIPGIFEFIPFLIIGVTIAILVVMIIKKKPLNFYVINVAIYIFTIIIILVASSLLKTMYFGLVDVRRVRLVRDLVTMVFFMQFVSAVILTIRATGFDIKKFNFKEDLQQLEISEEDREEFEVQVNFNKNKIFRKIKQKKRFLLYAYKENKLIFNTIGISLIVVITYFITSSIINNKPITDQNAIFSGNGFSIGIIDGYLTKTDYKGNVIDTNNYYLLLKIKIKSNNKPNSLDTATTKIVIGNYYYIPTYKNKDKFLDFGEIYYNETIGTEYEEKILLYEIPQQLVKQKFIFSYVNKNSFSDKKGFQKTNISLKYNDLTGNSTKKQYEIGETMSLKKSIFPDYNITIENYDIQTKYKLSYNYCISKECIKSYEYLTPKYNTNYDKALLKINGVIEKKTQTNKIYSLYDFIEMFGEICYTKGGKTNIISFKDSQINSTKAKPKDTYYIEVPKEVMNADSIYLTFTIRDKIYEYILK